MSPGLKSDTSAEEAHFVLNSGDKFPAVGLGVWKVSPDVAKDVVYTAIVEANYRHIDGAFIYGNEKEVGEGLKAAFDAGIKREDVFVTTKLWVKYTSPEKVKPAFLKSLKDLGLKYLDLYLIHWPVHTTEDATQPPKDGQVLPFDLIGTWKALEELVHEKLVRNIGVSNFSVRKMDALLKGASIPPAVNQVELHAGLRNEKLVEHARNNNYHLTAYSPLGSGGTGVLEEPAVQEIATKLGKTPAQILIRWLLQTGVSAVPKSTTPHRIKENIGVFGWSLSSEDMKKLSSFAKQARVNFGAELRVKEGEDEEKLNAEFWSDEI